MLIPHALLRIDRAPPSSVSLLFCAFTLRILRKYLQTNARKPQRLSNFFKTWVIKDFLRIIWVNIGRIFVGKLGENCQSSLVFCGYDDWRSDKAENYTRRGTGAPASNYNDEAKKFEDSKSTLDIVSCSFQCKDEVEVKRAAVESVRVMGGNTNDEVSVLGQYEVQLGVFKGKTFK